MRNLAAIFRLTWDDFWNEERIFYETGHVVLHSTNQYTSIQR
jgi:hypothetical protein